LDLAWWVAAAHRKVYQPFTFDRAAGMARPAVFVQ